jgi:hypothetical protein
MESTRAIRAESHLRSVHDFLVFRFELRLFYVMSMFS